MHEFHFKYIFIGVLLLYIHKSKLLFIYIYIYIRRELRKMRGWTTSDVKKENIYKKRFGQRPSSVIYNF